MDKEEIKNPMIKKDDPMSRIKIGTDWDALRRQIDHDGKCPYYPDGQGGYIKGENYDPNMKYFWANKTHPERAKVHGYQTVYDENGNPFIYGDTFLVEMPLEQYNKWKEGMRERGNMQAKLLDGKVKKENAQLANTPRIADGKDRKDTAWVDYQEFTEEIEILRKKKQII